MAKFGAGSKDRCTAGAIIVAAGESSRMAGQDKIMAPLGGKPVLAWSIEALQKSSRIDRIVIVNNRKTDESVRCLVAEKKWGKVSDICLGGKLRQDSVAAGLALLEDCEWVLIHDGARPFLTQDLIERGLDATRETGAAVAAVPVTDTIKRIGENGLVIETPPRHQLGSVQTPQVFGFEIIKAAYKEVTDEVTDDASLVEKIGYKVKLFRGSVDNIKITTPLDLQLAELLVKNYA